MRDARDSKITLEEACEFFENDKSILDANLRRYGMYIVWEIGGSPDSYKEFLELLESRTSEAELIRYIGNRGHHWPWD